MAKSIVIIPGRGGSKRLQHKNILPFHGIPLIAHSILYAKKFPNLVSQIIVSTEDNEIKAIAQEYGAEIIDRPTELASDHSTTAEVLQHTVTKLTTSFDYVITLQATNPLRPESLLPNCLQKLKATNYAKSLFSISPAPKKVGTLNASGNFRPLTYTAGARSQDLPELYFENGLIYITQRELIQAGIIFDEHSLTYIVENPYGHCDIDTEADFHYSLHLFEKYNNQQ